MSPTSHPRSSARRSIAEFERDREHLCKFMQAGPIQAIEHGARRILIRAPVKSGKRQMCEYLALRDEKTPRTRRHMLLTQWHRKADQEQRDELRQYGIEVLSGIRRHKREDYNAKIHELITGDRNLALIIHIDECDHGSGNRQAMADVWKQWRDEERVLFILYSATPEEVIYSGEIAEPSDVDNGSDSEMLSEFGEGVRFDYAPPPTFCGPARFIDEGLVFESCPFFEKVPQACGGSQRSPSFRLTEQGSAIIDDLRQAMRTNPKRNVLILRLAYGDSDALKSRQKSNTKENKAIYQFLRHVRMFEELEDCLIYVDKDEQPDGIDELVISEKIQWSNVRWWQGLTTGSPVIVVCDQTFSRSTEFAAHHRAFATHDYRNQITFSISSQAVERMNHYSTKYDTGFQPIRLYCHRKTLLLSAGRISYEEFLRNEWEMKKVRARDSRTSDRPPMFTIRTSDPTHQPHDDYPHPMTEADARVALAILGCGKRLPKLSARVTGDVSERVVIRSRSVPCVSASEFDRLTREGRLDGNDGSRPSVNLFHSYAPNLDDPDPRFRSNIRGDRRVRTVAEVEREHWGVSAHHRTRRHICYTDAGACVVLIQSFDGLREVDGLTAHGSMYRPRPVDGASSGSLDSE